MTDETVPDGGHAQDTELKDSNPNAAGPERAAGGMGISSERVGVAAVVLCPPEPAVDHHHRWAVRVPGRGQPKVHHLIGVVAVGHGAIRRRRRAGQHLPWVRGTAARSLGLRGAIQGGLGVHAPTVAPGDQRAHGGRTGTEDRESSLPRAKVVHDD